MCCGDTRVWVIVSEVGTIGEEGDEIGELIDVLGSMQVIEVSKGGCKVDGLVLSSVAASI